MFGGYSGVPALMAFAASAWLLTAQPAYSGEDVADRATAAQQIQRLQRHLRGSGLGGRITACPVMVMVRHHARNRVIGSVCSVRTASGTRNLLMCADDSIGHFALATTFSHDRDDVTRFAYQNCGGWTDAGTSDPGNSSF